MKARSLANMADTEPEPTVCEGRSASAVSRRGCVAVLLASAIPTYWTPESCACSSPLAPTSTRETGAAIRLSIVPSRTGTGTSRESSRAAVGSGRETQFRGQPPELWMQAPESPLAWSGHPEGVAAHALPDGRGSEGSGWPRYSSAAACSSSTACFIRFIRSGIGRSCGQASTQVWQAVHLPASARALPWRPANCWLAEARWKTSWS